MRRIDLFCKLFAPVFISFVDSFSTKVAIWTVFGLNASWVVIEYLAIAQVSRTHITRRPTVAKLLPGVLCSP